MYYIQLFKCLKIVVFKVKILRFAFLTIKTLVSNIIYYFLSHKKNPLFIYFCVNPSICRERPLIIQTLLTITNYNGFNYDRLLDQYGCWCYVQEQVICTTSDRKMEVNHFKSERSHKSIVLKFWVRMWCLSYLCGCSCLDVGGLTGSLRDPTMVSELRFGDGSDRLLVSKVS